MTRYDEAVAREYSEALGMIGAGWWRQVAWAHRQGIPKALGLTTRDWVTTYVGGWAKLLVEDRREAVKELIAPEEEGGMGLSQRAAADVLGVSDDTVRRDAAANAAPENDPEVAAAANAAPGGLAEAEWAPSSGLMSSESAEWYTPRHIVEAVVMALGGIDLDPCADPERSIPASAHYTAREDGLSRPWHGRVYMNPPYGRPIVAWAETLRREYDAGRVTSAVALIPARTETDWWAALNAELVCFIHGRLSFSGHENSAPFPSAAVYLGRDGEDFCAAFSSLGEVYRRVS